MTVELMKEKEICILHLCELRIDAENVDRMFKKLKSSLNKAQLTVINLQGVNYLDSSGLGMLLKCYREIKAAGNEMCIVNQSEIIQSLFNLVYMEKIVSVYSSLSDVHGGYNNISVV